MSAYNDEIRADEILGRAAEVLKLPLDLQQRESSITTLARLRATIAEPTQSIQCIDVAISPVKGLNILFYLDHKFSEVQLVPEAVPEGAPLRFGVWVDGTDTVHSVHLKNDGTWTFQTKVAYT